MEVQGAEGLQVDGLFWCTCGEIKWHIKVFKIGAEPSEAGPRPNCMSSVYSSSAIFPTKFLSKQLSSVVTHRKEAVLS